MIAAQPSARRWDIVGVGENSVDTVLRLPGAPRLDGLANKLRIRSHAQHCGGQVATTLGACAALGLRTAYIGAIGNDANGALITRALTTAGIDLSHAVTRPGPNRFAVILIDERSGERAVLWDRDASLDLVEDDVPASVVASASVVHVDTTSMRASLRAVALAREAGAVVTTDIDSVVGDVDALMAQATFAMVSEHFVAAFTGAADIVEGLRRLRERIPAVIVATLGASGAIALDGDEIVRAPGCVVDAVDTTGAGDVFRGAFIAALLRGDGLAERLRFANAAAAVSCTKPGALNSVPTLTEIDALLRQP